ncbi:MAG: PAS domain-containing sensor histidine kinase [Acidimicrobiales bacterium]
MSASGRTGDGAVGPPGRSDRLRLAQALAELADVQLELEQERLRRSDVESLFDLVLGEMSDAVVLADARGRIWRVNAAAARLAGKPAEQLLERTVSDLLGEGCPATPWEVFDRSNDGRLEAFECRAASHDRGAVPVSASCSVLRDATGKVVGTVYAARDLSETEHLVHKLEEAEARWRLMAELGDFLTDHVSPGDALTELCRWLAEATDAGIAVVLVTGTLVSRVAAWPDDVPVATGLAALAGQALRDRTSALWLAAHEGRTVLAPVLGRGFPFLPPVVPVEGIGSAAVVPLAARDNKLGALLVHSGNPGSVSDRTLVLIEAAAARIALALANAELREALADAQAAQQAAAVREEMLAAVSHDMQTPLSVLLGSIEALRSSPRPAAAERDRLYTGMARQATQLRRLVQQALDFSRLEAGQKVVVRPRPTDVAAVVEGVEKDLSGRWPLHVDVPDDLPLALVDPDRLHQVLTNLLSNAMKFSDPGSPISVAARATTGTVEIVVADRGQGMSPADLANAFEKFHRGRPAAQPGTGLGLYVSRALLEAQGGHITATSRLGEGSRFTIVLPPAGGAGTDDDCASGLS